MGSDPMSGFQVGKRNLPGLTAQDYLAMVLRGKWIILGIFAGVLVAALLYAKLAPRVYQSSAGILINTKFSETPTPLFLEARGSNPLQSPVQNEMEILKSRSLADTVVKALIARCYSDPATKTLLLLLRPSPDDTGHGGIATIELVIKRLESAVSFEAVREADVIRVTAKSKNPREAAIIANEYARAYYNRNIFASRLKSRSIRKSLETQLREKQIQLAMAEDSLKGYMQAKGVVSLDAEATKVINQLAQLEAARDGVEIEIRTLAKNITAYKEDIAAQEKTVATVMEGSNDPYIRLIQEQLAKLEVQRDMTIAQNPTISGNEIYGATLKEIDGQIVSLRSKLKSRTDQYLTNILPSQEGSGQQEPAGYLRQVKQKMMTGQIEIQALLAKRDALNAAIQQYDRQFGRIPERSLRYARLQREKLSIEKLYLLIEEKYNEASLIEQSEFGFVDIFDPAVVPVDPSSPKPFLLLVMGALLGLSLGLTFVFVREFADVRIQTPEELKKRGFVVLATIANMNKELRRLGGFTNGSGKKGSSKLFLVALKSPFSAITESFRLLRTNLEFTRRDQPLRIILITSCSPGEGKSTTSANLALVLAQSGKKVLLIDADLRSPKLHETFEVRQKPGLSDLLSNSVNSESVILKTPVKNLFIMTCGTLPPNPAELLGFKNMKDYLDGLRQQYDVILIDSPPVLAVTDPCVLSTVADGVIVVISAGETRLSDLEQCVDLLAQVHGKMPAVVLNNFNMQRAYGFTYGRSGYGHYRYADGYHLEPLNGKGHKKIIDRISS